MASSAWRSKAALVLASLTFAASLTGLVGEWTLRYRERHRTTVPGTMAQLYYRHQSLGHALVRNYSYFGWVHVNAQGFRGPDVALAKPEGTIRIMAVGGSTTFDSYVSADDRAWPARLAARLHELAPDRRVEVINAGVPGYVVLQDIIRLPTEYHLYSPDVIIFYQAHNDLFRALRPPADPSLPPDPTPGEVKPITPWTYWLDRHSLLYGKVVDRWNAIQSRRFGARAQAPPPDLVEHGAAQFGVAVNAFLAMARSMNIAVIVPEVVQVSGVGATQESDPAITAMWATSVPYAPPERVLRSYVQFNAELKAAAERQGARFVPTESFGLKGRDLFAEGDPIHFSDAGADRMALGMAKAIVSLGVLGGATAR